MLFVNDKRQYDNTYSSRNFFGLANTSIISYDHKTEFIYRYKDYFVRRKGLESDLTVDRSRKFFINSCGVVECRKGSFLISDFLRSRFESRRRSLDLSYRYALSNDWSYFCTFTFDPSKVNVDDSSLIYLWKLFRQRLQYMYSDIKIYCVPERHKNGVLHFHALLGNCDLTDVLVRAYHDDKPLFTSFNDPIYNFNTGLYDYGFTTVVPIRSGSKDRVVNYLTKYVTKSSSVSFNCKSFYHTNNLQLACKISAFLLVDELFDILKNNASIMNAGYFVNVRKNTDDYIIFDVFGDFDLSRFTSQSYRCMNDSVNIT